MTYNKQKLIAALKARRQQIVTNNQKRQAEYKKAVEAYRQATIKMLLAAIARVKKAPADCSKIYNCWGPDEDNQPDRPSKPHNRPATAAIDKMLVELELCKETQLTLDASKNALSILRGEEDRYEREYDDDDDYGDEE